jgi:hypothetical protein
MSGKRTPCPTWCQTDHTSDPRDGHTHFLGEYGPVQVSAYVWPSNPTPVVRLTNRRPLRSGDDAHPTVTDVEWGEALGLAALMDTLGNREISGLIRDAVELIEDEADNQPVLTGGARAEEVAR